MCPDHPHPQLADGIAPESDLPLVLRLRGIDRPALAELLPHHPLYDLAAWTCWHLRELPPPSRRSFLAALEKGWPRARGESKNVEHRRLMAWTMVQNGSTDADVAEAFAVALETAKRWRRDFLHEVDPDRSDERYLEPGVCVSDDRDQKPRDPASLTALAESFRHKPEQLDNLRRTGII